MKVNLKNCSIIIPFRSNKLRRKILFKVLDFLNKNFDTEILLAEHDYEKKLNSNEIEKIIKDDNDLKKIDWIFKNKIK